jgi:hypothetical protein
LKEDEIQRAKSLENLDPDLFDQLAHRRKWTYVQKNP